MSEGTQEFWPSAQLLLNLLGVSSTPPAINTTILAGKFVFAESGLQHLSATRGCRSAVQQPTESQPRLNASREQPSATTAATASHLC